MYNIITIYLCLWKRYCNQLQLLLDLKAWKLEEDEEELERLESVWMFEDKWEMREVKWGCSLGSPIYKLANSSHVSGLVVTCQSKPVKKTQN